MQIHFLLSLWNHKIVLLSAHAALCSKDRLLGLLLDFNDKLGLPPITVLMLSHISSGTPCHCSWCSSFVCLQLLVRVGVAFSAICSDGFWKIHKSTQNKSIENSYREWFKCFMFLWNSKSAWIGTNDALYWCFGLERIKNNNWVY